MKKYLSGLPTRFKLRNEMIDYKNLAIDDYEKVSKLYTSDELSNKQFVILDSLVNNNPNELDDNLDYYEASDFIRVFGSGDSCYNLKNNGFKTNAYEKNNTNFGFENIQTPTTITNSNNASHQALVEEINILMDYAQDCYLNGQQDKNNPTFSNLIGSDNQKHLTSTPNMQLDAGRMVSASIDNLETYLIWMALNYDCNLSDLFNADGAYKEFLTKFLYKLNDLPYQFSDINSNKQTPNKRSVKERAFLYSKLNDVLNDIVSRIMVEITSYEDYEGDPAKKNAIISQTNKGVFLAKDPITNIKIKLEREKVTTTYGNRYKMLLIGKKFDLYTLKRRGGYKHKNVINLNDQAEIEDQNSDKRVAPSNYTYPLVAKTLYPYYSKILKQFQELCEIIKRFNSVNNDPNQAKDELDTFFSKFRYIMKKRILGSIQEDAIIQNDENKLYDTTTDFDYTLKINGFYDSYYLQVLINFIALRKVLHDYFNKKIDKNLMTNVNGIGVLTEIYRLPSFLEFYNTKVANLKKTQPKANIQANTQANTQQTNLTSKTKKLPFVIDTSYANSKFFQNATKNLVDTSIKNLNKATTNSNKDNVSIQNQQVPDFKKIEMTSGQRSDETTKAISRELQNKINFSSNNFVKSNELDDETQTSIDNQNTNTHTNQNESTNVSSLDVENPDQNKSSNVESSNTLLWTSIGLASLIGIGLYWKHNQRKKIK